MPAVGSIAVATQSAAVGTYWLRRLRERRLGMRAWVHTGNEVDIGLADVLSDFLDDPAIRTILCVLEQWRRPAELEVLLDRLPRSGKDLVVLPLGQSAVGRRAALSHTGGLVARGTDVVTGLLRQAGAHVVGGLEEGLLLAETLNAGLRRVGPRVGILTPSGGLGILLADALCGVGFELPEFDPALQAKWRGLVPFCSPRNPVDATAQMINQPELFTEFARDMVSSGQIDLLAAFLPTARPGDELSMSLVEVAAEARSRGVRIVAVGAIPAEVATTFSDHGIAVFQEPRDAARVLGLLLDDGARLRPPPAGRRRPADRAPRPRRPSRAGAGRIGPCLDGSRTTDELTVKVALARLGVDVVADVVVDDAEGAVDAAARLGFPVVLKRLQAGLGPQGPGGRRDRRPRDPRGGAGRGAPDPRRAREPGAGRADGPWRRAPGGPDP